MLFSHIHFPQGRLRKRRSNDPFLAFQHFSSPNYFPERGKGVLLILKMRKQFFARCALLRFYIFKRAKRACF